jgi:uncharacterized protein (DUF697 family)
MATFKDLTATWRNLREFELSPIQKEALQDLHILIAGKPGSGRHTLASQMRRDPSRPMMQTQSPVHLFNLEEAAQARRVDLLILLVDAAAESWEEERQVARNWTDAGIPAIILINKCDQLTNGLPIEKAVPWQSGYTLAGSALDGHFLLHHFVPLVLRLVPAKHLALGRQFPLFRLPIARQLISETSLANATYALGTGIAEVYPVLDIPLNITDMLILTKTQAFMVYRLGLLLGYTTRWQDYVTEFGSVIGSGFLWRQLARQLVGLIPVWGIAPKVAVSYAGTYVVGHTVLTWYLTGKHLTREQVNDLYRQALKSGRDHAQQLMDRMPKIKIGPPRLPRLALPAPKPPKARKPKKLVCPGCGKTSSGDAHFCQYCGKALGLEEPPEDIGPEIPLDE